MNDQDRKLLTELKTVLVGMDGTDDKGMAGDLKDIKVHLEILNGSVKANTAWRKVLVTIGGAVIGWLIKGEIA